MTVSYPQGDRWLTFIQALVETQDWRQLGDILARFLKGFIPFDRFAFTLVHDERGVAEVIVPEGGTGEEVRTGKEIPLEGTATGWVAQHHAPLIETEEDPKTPSFARELGSGFKSRFAMPVIVGEKVIAALVFHSHRPNAYSLSDAERLQPLMPLIALFLRHFLERRRMEKVLSEERRVREQLEFLRFLDNLLLSESEMPKVFQGFAEALRRFIPFDRLSFSVYDTQTNREWLFVAWHDRPIWKERQVDPFVPFGMAKEVMEEGKPLWQPYLDSSSYPAARWLKEQGFFSALVYPLPMPGRFKVTLNFSGRRPHQFHREHLLFLDSIADQISLLFRALMSDMMGKEYRQHLINLLQTSASLLAARSLEAFAMTLRQGLHRFGIEHSSFFLYQVDGKVVQGEWEEQGQIRWVEPPWLPQPLKAGETILGDILLGVRAIFVTNDPLKEVSERERKEWERTLQGKSYRFGNAIIPMQGHQRVVGAIAIDFRESRRYLSLGDELVRLLLTLGNLAGLAIENIWLEERLERQLKETQTLHRLILEAAAGTEMKKLAQSLVNALPQIIPCDTASVMMVTEDRKHLEYLASSLPPPPPFTYGMRFPLTRGITGYVARTGEAILERDVRRNPYYYPARPEMRSEVCVPIKAHGEVIGVILALSKRLGAFNEDHLNFLTTLAAQLGMVMEQTILTQQLSAIFETIQEGVALILPDGRLDDVNHRFGELVGVPAESLRNRPVQELRKALLDRAFNPKEMEEAIDQALASVTEPQFDELRLTEPETVLERYCLPVRLPDGSVLGQLWVLRDVTEDRKRRQELLRLERLRTLGELASGIAHDLNNTLTPVLSSAELLQSHPDPEVQALAKSIFQAAQHATGILRRLRSLYRITRPSAFMTVDINHLVQEAIAMTSARWNDEALAEGVTIHVETEFGENVRVRGDPTELRQVFINILLNAADAILERAKETGKRDGTIRVTTVSQRDQVIVTVSDDGIGMTEDIQRRIFEAFFTTKEKKGAGLGMSVALATIALHGGNIHVQSAPMEGTTVVISLPVSHRVREETPPEEPTPFPLPSWSILVVEDNPSVRQVVVEMLKRLGQRVITAPNGQEGWELLQREKVDLLVTDLSMPIMNGIELARKAREKFPGLPIVMMTGWGDFIPHETLREVGIKVVLSKPMRLQTWRETLQRLAREE